VYLENKFVFVMDRQTDRQADRQTDRQAGRQTNVSNLMSGFLPLYVANIPEPKAGQKTIYNINIVHSATTDCVAAPTKDSAQLR